MEIAIMVEGQAGLNWERWQHFAHLTESLGFVGLYRSDHFTNSEGPHLDSLECWTSLAWLASHTEKINFGPMVSPVSFRHPVWLARIALTIDDLSGGRLDLGVGAGWQEREHHSFGFNLGDMDTRFRRFREGLELIRLLTTSDTPTSFHGEFYQLNDALLLPRPKRKGGPRILIGGKGEKRTLPLVAEFASEWNGVFITPEQFDYLNKKLDQLLLKRNRPLDEVKRSLMTGVFFGQTDAEVKARLGGASEESQRQKGCIVGTTSAVQDQLAEFAAVGVQRIMLNWFDFDDINGLENLAKAVL